MTVPTASNPSIQIYNTESGRKERFEPSGPEVRMYVCGLTPKGDPHLGHGRLFVVNDTVRRYLTYRGYPVKYVQNFTDIDDKIIAAGQREGIAPSLAAQRYTQAYFRDMGRLGVERADVYTYVTDFIPRIIEMVQGLIERGHAYELEGDVYFSVPSFPDYGRLSGRTEEAMEAGARIEVDERKHDVRDFALWKAAKPGEPSWPSPWGSGRPGWHIECSTMAMQELGPTVDIHGGGSDLIFPHHENEIAQSESFSGVKPFVRYWLHTGMLSIADEKMAHSLGNFVTVRSVLAGEDVPGPALRTYLLSQLYRANLVFTDEPLRASVKRWRRWAETRANLVRLLEWAQQSSPSRATEEVDTALRDELASARVQFIAAMDDDFNTSLALGVLDELVHRINDYAHGLGAGAPTEATVATLRAALATLDELTGVLGIALEDPQSGPQLADEQVGEIERLLEARTAARDERNWAEADRIRKELAERLDVVIKDTPQGPTWSVRAPARA
jgi:cysteinyl-tRNA synthetase